MAKFDGAVEKLDAKRRIGGGPLALHQVASMCGHRIGVALIGAALIVLLGIGKARISPETARRHIAELIERTDMAGIGRLVEQSRR